MFKELFTEAAADTNWVYHDENTSRWGIDSKIRKFGSSFGELVAVFVTAQNSRSGRHSERWCFSVDSVAGVPQPGSGYTIVRYVSSTTLAGKMAPICAINPSLGKIKFLKDLDDSENMKWDKPLKCQYMRVVK